jgi:uncharacterized membrane protein
MMMISTQAIIYALLFFLLIFIPNVIYLINRWCHPKVNKGKPCGKYAEMEALEKFKKE